MTKSSKRLLLIDGHSMAYRAFYALPVDNFKTSTGQPTNAIYGFAAMIINLINQEKPTHIAVAFDVSRQTFRTEKFPEYKSNRTATPDEFRSQVSHIYEVVNAFGINRFELPGFEADDVIATLTKNAETEGFEVLICSGDRDTFQLVSEKTTVLYPKKGVTEMSRMTPDAVIEKYGLTPKQYPDFAALRGDPSDNLPSLPGVGEKTATKWIVDFGSLQDLIKNAESISGKVGDALRANIDQVKLNRELTQLQTNLELPSSLDVLKWTGIDPAEITKIFEALEIRALRERLKSLPQIGGSITSEIDIKVKVVDYLDLNQILIDRRLPIALSVEIADRKIISYAVALDESEVLHVISGKFGDWITIKKIEKNNKPIVPKINFKGRFPVITKVKNCT